MQFESIGETELSFLITLDAYVDGHLNGGSVSNSFFASLDSYFADIDMTDPTLIARYLIHLKIEIAILRKMYPNEPNWWYYKEATKELTHTMLELGGLIPVVGEVFDITNAVLYALEGDLTNAAISTASAIPFAGWFVSGAKYAYKGVHRYKRLDNGVVYFVSRNSKKVRKILNLGPFSSDPRYAHHIIPWEFRSHPLVQKAAKSIHHFDEAVFLFPFAWYGYIATPSRVNHVEVSIFPIAIVSLSNSTKFNEKS